MICSRCGISNKSGAKFCRGCGANLADVAANVALPEQEHTVPAVQPVAVNAKPVSAPRAARRGIPRIVLLLLVLVVVFAIDGFFFFLKFDVLDTEDTVKYNFREFSISMSSDMLLHTSIECVEELEINDEEFIVPFEYYKYYLDEDSTFFFAYASDCKYESSSTDTVKGNCGEITYQLAKQESFFDLMPDFRDGADKPYKVDNGIIRFRGMGADDNMYYFYGKEIVEYGNIYICCFISPYQDDDRVISWLSTVKVKDHNKNMRYMSFTT